MIFSEMQLLIAIIRDETDKSDRKQNTSMPFSVYNAHKSISSIDREYTEFLFKNRDLGV